MVIELVDIDLVKLLEQVRLLKKELLSMEVEEEVRLIEEKEKLLLRIFLKVILLKREKEKKD